MSKHGTDDRGWPLVPVDPAAIPEGYEAVRVGLPRAGELCARAYGDTHCWSNDANAFGPVRLIIRPIKPPIELPLSIVPHGWWVAKDKDGWVCLHEKETQLSPSGCRWTSIGKIWPIPPWIAAQLPREWHDLPWDQSAVQQQEGGEA